MLLSFLTYFAATTTCDKPRFFGLVPWYEYLSLDPAHNCAITNFNDSAAVLGAQSPALLIALAILDDLLRVAALIAVGYIIYGGIMYTTSQGAPDMIKKAQQTVINALIGLGVALVATSVVAFIGRSIGS